MSKKWKSYLGGHTVLKQHPSDFYRQMAIDAAKAKKRAKKQQAIFDRLNGITTKTAKAALKAQRAYERHCHQHMLKRRAESEAMHNRRERRVEE
jgi:hypothetical protein